MLSHLDDEIIMRAAAAEHDYWLLVRRCDDSARKLALFDRRIAIDAKLRGEPPPAPAPLWAPLEVAVDVELERRRDLIRTEVTLQRQRSRTALGCGLVQIRLGRRASARRKLHALTRGSPLSLQELADVFGIEVLTIKNHLAGRRIARARSNWYHRLERVELVGDCVHVVVRYRPAPKRWGWKFTREQKRLILSGVRSKMKGASPP
jgi:hypothetical protein